MHGFTALFELVASAPVGLACALLLSAIFGWAGATKLHRPFPAAVAAMNLRVVRRPRKGVGVTIGMIESAIAVGLLYGPTRTIAAALAVLLSAVFFVAVSAALHRGEHFACACFGDSDDRIGAHTLARSGFMAGAGTVVAASGATQAGTLEIWAQAVVLAALIIGVPTLLASLARLRNAEAELDEALDWEWILQRQRGDDQHLPAFARMLTRSRT